jgi:hypothetical protein
MPGLTIRPIREDIRQLQSEALIVGFYEDVRPLKGLAGELDWLLCGSLSRLILMNKLRGAPGDMALLTSQGKVPAQKIFLLGLGPREGFSEDALRNAAGNAARSALAAGLGGAVIEYFQSPDIPRDKGLAALYEGLKEGAGGRSFDALLLAPEAGAYEFISHYFKAH